ncbi:hypothetical protein [Pseudomonas sp. CNPSo 3701]|uniref:hypothetical protein n=1 Tax=Pseudomonas sp. CNPSo 3701 TaxID=3027943 RepID=UPI0023643BF2|nr:hypothetical protein [Pseudomonas sp. CNPSo 3701]MDD1506636.1 hypothetical protein [Pseudomonas sp. CNPSo 3701]
MNQPQSPRFSDDGVVYPRGAQRDAMVAELTQLIERVPEQMEFTNTKRYWVLGPVLTLGALGILWSGVSFGKTGLIICGGFMTLFFMLLTWQHRNAGREVFMRLTRRELHHTALSGPVDLTKVVDVFVKDEGLLTLQKLTLSDTASLPTHRAVSVLFGNQAMALKKPQPHVRINSAGVATGGSKLDIDDLHTLLTAYVQAALAQQQLDTLKQHG